MVELKIKINEEWVYLDIDQETPFPLEFNLVDIRDISKRNISFSKTIALPISKKNNDTLDYLFDSSASSSIDVRKNLPCVATKDGLDIFVGNVIINQVRTSDNKRFRYDINLTNTLSNIVTKLDKTNLDNLNLSKLDHEVNFTNIFDSWENKLPYFYPLIDYNNNWSSGELKKTGIRSTDMKPALRVDYLWNELFTFTDTSYISKSINEDKIYDRVILPATSKEIKISNDFIRQNTFRAGLSVSWRPSPLGSNIYYLPNNPNRAYLRFSELVGNESSNQFNPIYVPFDNVDNDLGNFDFNNLFDTNNRSFINKNTKLNQRFNLNLDIKVYNKYQDPVKGGDIYVRFWRQFNPETGATEKYPIEIANFKNDLIDYPFKQTGIDTANIIRKEAVFITKPSGAFNSNLSAPNFTYLALSPFNEQGFSSTGIAGSASIVEEYNDDTSGFKRYNLTISTVFLDGTTPKRKPLLLGERVWVEINTGFSSLWYEDFVKPEYLNTGVPPFEITPETYFYNELSDRNLDSSYQLDFASIFPQNIKALDIFNNLIKMYNLFIEVDKRDPNILVIETRDNFYTGEYLDWSDKLDESEEITTELLVQKFANIRLTHKEDNDVLNTDYKNNFNKLYGEYNFDTGNEWTKEEQKIETTFGPTPVYASPELRSVVYPLILSEGSTSNKNEFVGRNIRILQHSPFVLEPCLGNDSIKIDGVTLSYYPYAGHFSRPLEGDNDINFGMSDKIYFDLNKINNNNLFELYWRKMLEEYTDKDSRLITARFYLTPEDIYNFSFRKLIKVDKLSSDSVNYFKVNKIEYDPTRSGSYKVELIKTRDFNVIPDCYCYEATNIPYNGGSFSIFKDGEWIDKTNELIITERATGRDVIWKGGSCDELKQYKIETPFGFEVSGTKGWSFSATSNSFQIRLFPTFMEKGIDTEGGWLFNGSTQVSSLLQGRTTDAYYIKKAGFWEFNWNFTYSIDVNWPYTITDPFPTGGNNIRFQIVKTIGTTGSQIIFDSEDIETPNISTGLNEVNKDYTIGHTFSATEVSDGVCIFTKVLLTTRSNTPPYTPEVIIESVLKATEYPSFGIKYGAIDKLVCKPILNVPRIVRRRDYSPTGINTGRFNQNGSNNDIIVGNENTIGYGSEGSVVVGNNNTVINSNTSIINSFLNNVYNSDWTSIIGGSNVTINESDGSISIGSTNILIDSSENVIVIGGSNETIQNQSNTIILGQSTINKVDIISSGIDEVLGRFPTGVPFNLISASIDDVRNLGGHTIVNLISAQR